MNLFVISLPPNFIVLRPTCCRRPRVENHPTFDELGAQSYMLPVLTIFVDPLCQP